MRSLCLLAVFAALACGKDEGSKDATASPPDGGARADALPNDAVPADEGTALAPDAAPDAGRDGGAAEDAGADAGSDAGPTYNCGIFTEDPGWTVSPGYRAVVIADATGSLNQPVALTFAYGAFRNLLYVVNQGNNTLTTVDVNTGDTTVFVPAESWSLTPSLLTAIIYDRAGVFDQNLYVADQGSDGDNDSVIFRVTTTGTVSTFTRAPGPGLDDIYGFAFSSGGLYPAGLYVTGDSDGANTDWGLYDAAGLGAPFSTISGCEGIAFGDANARFGGLMYAALPLGGGFDGDGTITPNLSDGTAGTPLASNLGGVHASVFSPGGAFGTDLYSAVWSSGQLIQTSTSGAVRVLASGLSLTNYDANILDFSPDGNVLFVADRLANRVVCIEPR